MKAISRHDIKRFAVVTLAAILMALNLKSFVQIGGLFPGGATGLAVLIQRSCRVYFNISVPFSLVNLLLNSIPVYIGFRYIGKKFTLFSLWMILVNSIMTDLIPAFEITYDPLLISLFGGLIGGVSVSMCLSVDATSGGTDFIGIYLSQKKNMDSFNVILYFNAAMLAVAGLLFGWDKALYSIVYQFVSTEVIHTLYRNYQQQTLFVVTDHPTQICKVIYDTCKHGATILDGKGSYEHDEKKLVYSVVTGEDAKVVIPKIHEADSKAFVNSFRSSEIRGNFYQRPKD